MNYLNLIKMKNATYLITILFSIIICLKCDGQPSSKGILLDKKNNIVVGKNIAIKSQFVGLPVVEPHISAHPSDNNFLLAAAMIVTDKNNPYQSCRLSSFVSQDGGATWKETAHDWWGLRSLDGHFARWANGHELARYRR